MPGGARAMGRRICCGVLRLWTSLVPGCCRAAVPARTVQAAGLCRCHSLGEQTWPRTCQVCLLFVAIVIQRLQRLIISSNCVMPLPNVVSCMRDRVAFFMDALNNYSSIELISIDIISFGFSLALVVTRIIARQIWRIGDFIWCERKKLVRFWLLRSYPYFCRSCLCIPTKLVEVITVKSYSET